MGTRLLTMLVAAGTALTSSAAPSLMNYSGRLLDSTGNVVDSSTARVNVKIYSDLTGGTLLYEDDNAGVTVAGGMYRVVVGDDASAHGATYTSLTDALGADDSVYLEIEIDDDGAGGMTTLTPREQLHSIPFSIGSDIANATSLSDADGDTKVQVEETPDDDTIRFDTAGVQRMVVAPDGEVGIATGTPTSGLNFNTSLGRKVVSKTSNYTVTASDNVVLIDAGSSDVVITLPSTAGIAGREYVFKVIDATNDVRITTSGSDLLDGGNILPLDTRYDLVGVVTDGSDWHISYFMDGDELTTMDAGDGADGALTVSAADTVINDYARATGDEAAGSWTITVNDGSAFAVGDEIFIHQTQDGVNGNQGVHEFAEIAAISGNDLGLTAATTNDYYSGSFDTNPAEVTQVVRVPNHTTVTINNGASITADAWDGYDGGIVVFRASGTVTFNGTGEINVDGKGFRGGDCNGGGNNDPGDQGEGYPGTGAADDETANGNGGGAGLSDWNGEAGAGGGNQTVGADGVADTLTTDGGLAVGDADLDTIFFGGGGGGGGDNDGGTPIPVGGDGGGAVIVFAKEISNAAVSAEGASGLVAPGAGGTGGSGAGGVIWLKALNISTSSISVDGAAGVSDGNDFGGAGGDGWTLIEN